MQLATMTHRRSKNIVNMILGKWLIAALVMALGQTTAADAQNLLRPRGDVNADWETSLADVNALSDTLMTSKTGYNATWSYAADVNGDREVSINDINSLVGLLLGDDPTMLAPSGTLPVLYINTDGYLPITNKEDYLHATWWLDDMGVAGVEPLGSPDQPLGMQIKGRGNYTWAHYDKKPYRVKLDKKQPLLGMKANKHFCLMAHADDSRGFTKDQVGFEVSRRMGLAWTPTEQPVELVLNGHYWGLYFITEKIRVETDRVNVEKQADGERSGVRVTGGWLLEIDNYGEENSITFVEDPADSTNLVIFTPHSPEELSARQRWYITTFLTEANAVIYSDSIDEVLWDKYIDIDTLACHYIVNEVLEVNDAYHGSCFIHKQRGDSTKLLFGPVWDFGEAFVKSYFDTTLDEFFYNAEPLSFTNHWIKQIATHSELFQQCVRKHWARFYEQQYPTLDDYIAAFVARIVQAGESDSQRWPQYNGGHVDWAAQWFMRDLLEQHVAWLNEQWGE